MAQWKSGMFEVEEHEKECIYFLRKGEGIHERQQKRFLETFRRCRGG